MNAEGLVAKPALLKAVHLASRTLLTEGHRPLPMGLSDGGAR